MDKALYAKILNKAYGKNATPEDRRLAKLIMFSAYGLFGATLPYVPRETTEKGDDNMEQRKFKVGDIVKGNHPIFAKGKIGIIEEVDETDDELPYRVDFIGETDYWIEEKFLELAEEKKMENVFELEMGKHVVETRNGNHYLLVKHEEEIIIGLNLDIPNSVVTLFLDENLQDVEDHNFDIKRVYEYMNTGFSKIKEKLSDPVWERKEVKEMTMKEICEALGYEVKIKKED